MKLNLLLEEKEMNAMKYQIREIQCIHQLEAYKQVLEWIKAPYDVPLEHKVEMAIKEKEEVLKNGTM